MPSPAAQLPRCALGRGAPLAEAVERPGRTRIDDGLSEDAKDDLLQECAAGPERLAKLLSLLRGRSGVPLCL
jgi:hypothetical protein